MPHGISQVCVSWFRHHVYQKKTKKKKNRKKEREVGIWEIVSRPSSNKSLGYMYGYTTLDK